VVLLKKDAGKTGESTTCPFFFLVVLKQKFPFVDEHIVASVVCMSPVGADPKGTFMIVSVIYYNNFLLTLKNIKQKYLSMGMLLLINARPRYVKNRKPNKGKKPACSKKYSRTHARTVTETV
jgi:hypothetical protein